MRAAFQEPFVLALDLGTSSVRATVYDSAAQPLPGACASRKHEPANTPDGGSELDADALVETTVDCAAEALDGARGRRIDAVGVCSFWHSILGVDRAGRAATPVSLWSDTRSVDQVEELRALVDERALHARTGCRLHTSYLPARLLRIRERQPNLFAAVRRWVSPGEYLFLRLLGDAHCSVSMASGTGLFDQAAVDWDVETVAALALDRDRFSPIATHGALSQGLSPEYADRLPALRRARWLPALGDGACSNVGSGCTDSGRLALMIGTSGALRLLTEAWTSGAVDEWTSGRSEDRTRPFVRSSVRPPVHSSTAPVPFGLWHYRLDRRRHLVGGALSNGGSLAAWLRETLRLAGDDLESAVGGVEPDAHGLTFLPFLAGERCPNWRGDARAAIVGLSSHTTPAHVARAGLEAVAYRFTAIHDLLRPFAADGYELVGSGGALRASPEWQQILADVLNRPLGVCAEPEATSRGAALMALEAVGAIPDAGRLPPAMGPIRLPQPVHAAWYAEGRERHERLYRRLIAEAW